MIPCIKNKDGIQWMYLKKKFEIKRRGKGLIEKRRYVTLRRKKFISNQDSCYRPGFLSFGGVIEHSLISPSKPIMFKTLY